MFKTGERPIRGKPSESRPANHLADDVADPVAGLLKIQVLLEAHQVAIETQPTARGVRGGEGGRNDRADRGAVELDRVRVERRGRQLDLGRR